MTHNSTKDGKDHKTCPSCQQMLCNDNELACSGCREEYRKIHWTYAIYFALNGVNLDHLNIAYGVTDGINLSIATIKCFFEVIFYEARTKELGDIIHESLLSPEWLIPSLLITGIFALTAAYVNKPDTPKKPNSVIKLLHAPPDEVLKAEVCRMESIVFVLQEEAYYIGYSKDGEYDKRPVNKDSPLYTLLNKYALKNTPLTEQDELLLQNYLTLQRIHARKKHTSGLQRNFLGRCIDWIVETFKNNLDFIWRCMRGIVKSFKNSFKGLKTISSLVLLWDVHIGFLILPLGLALSGLAVLNRIWVLRMQEDRKAMKKANMDILTKIQWGDMQAFNDIKQQSWQLRAMALVSAGLGGALNSAYLYMGFLSALTVASISIAWPLFVTMAAFCVVYSVIHIVSAIYEEYTFQRDLTITVLRAGLAYEAKQIEHKIRDNAFSSDDEVKAAVAQLHVKSKELNELLSVSSRSAMLLGLLNGLAVYRAVAAVLAFAMLFIVVSNPAVAMGVAIAVITCISSGLLFLAAFTLHSYCRHRPPKEAPENPWALLEKGIIAKKTTVDTIEELNKTIEHETEKKPKQLYIKELSEMGRLFFSGLNKGPKAIDYGLNACLEKSARDKNYHEPSSLLPIAVFTSILESVILTARYVAKTFKPDGLEKKIQPFSMSKYGMFSKAQDSKNPPHTAISPPSPPQSNSTFTNEAAA